MSHREDTGPEIFPRGPNWDGPYCEECDEKWPCTGSLVQDVIEATIVLLDDLDHEAYHLSPAHQDALDAVRAYQQRA